MSRSTSFFLVLVLLTTAVSAEQPPSPRPINIPDIVPAAYRQELPDVAWNGSTFVAVWTDSRKTPTLRATDLAVFAARIDDRGKVIDNYGIEIADFGFGPRVASNGNGSVISYTGRRNSHAVRIDDDGRLAGAPLDLGDGQVLDIASNGETYCAIVNSYPEGSRALILDETGAIMHTVSIEGYVTAVIAADGNYHVFSARGRDLLGTTVRPTGSKSVRHIVTSEIAEPLSVAIAGDDSVLVAWHATNQELSAYEYVVVDDDLESLTDVRRVSGGLSYGSDWEDTPSLAWDGSIFALSWEEYQASQRVVRIDDDGEQLDPKPIELVPRIVRFASAFSGDVTLLVSEESLHYKTDLRSRALRSLHALPEIGEGRVMAFSATPQMLPDVAYSAGANVAAVASIDGDGPDSIMVTLFQRGLTNRLRRRVSPYIPYTSKEGASIAAADGTFLVTWRELTNFNTLIAARRITADGVFLGGQIPIARHTSFIHFGETAVATEGNLFLVVWDAPDGEIHGRRIRANGEFLDPAPFLISRHPATEERERRNPAVVWTGAEFLVAWSEHESYYTAPPAGRTTIRGARVTAEGAVLDAGESKTFFARPGHGTGVDVALGKSGMMLVASFTSWITTDLMNVAALPLDLGGNAKASEPVRIDATTVNAELSSPTVAAVEDSFYALWGEQTSDASRARGTHLSASGEIIDRFDVGPNEAFTPSATNADGAILVVQSQLDSRQSNVVRLFGTSFVSERRAPHRGRTVRH